MCCDSSPLSLSTMRPTLPPEPGGAALFSEIAQRADHCFRDEDRCHTENTCGCCNASVEEIKTHGPWKEHCFHRLLTSDGENPLRCLSGTQGL